MELREIHSEFSNGKNKLQILENKTISNEKYSPGNAALLFFVDDRSFLLWPG